MNKFIVPEQEYHVAYMKLRQAFKEAPGLSMLTVAALEAIAHLAIESIGHEVKD